MMGLMLGTKPRKAMELLTAVCEVYGVELDRMYEPGNDRPCSEIRGMVAMLIQNSEGIKLTTLAKELGRVTCPPLARQQKGCTIAFEMRNL